ncbi:uncharacterized protein LOC142354405 [Convolutriloba macropyga]|uniref:uncharacterized protein LOC142354405 n=1 Tax=Convolutriloba macropyga TaxID=536237 RepID=UPI003F51E531
MASLSSFIAVFAVFCSYTDSTFKPFQCYDCVGSSSDDTLDNCLDTPTVFHSIACVTACQTDITYDTNEVISVRKKCYPACEEKDDRNPQTGSGVVTTCCDGDLCNMSHKMGASYWIHLVFILATVIFRWCTVGN